MTHISDSTILVVGGQILTTGDFVFQARQESIDDVIDDFGPPIINLIVPSYIMEGEEREIIMSGNRTYNPLGLGISGAGVTVEDVYVDSDGQVTTRIEVAADSANIQTANADDLRSITVTTLPGQTDSDGESIEQQSIFANELRIYFSAPSLSSIAYADAGGSPIVNQGDTVTATITGTKFYDKWDNNQDMASSLGDLAAQGLTLTGMTVDSPTQATATFTVAADASRQSHSVKTTTYSGDSNELASNLTVYYSAPTLASLAEQSGANMTSIAAGETKSLRLSGSRLEGVDAPARIEVGQVDAGGNFNPSPTQEDGSGNVVLSSFATISNVSASTPAGAGTNHTVDFDLAMAQNIPSDLANIGFRVTALDAGGALQTVLPIAEAFSIDAAEPTISDISVAGRPAGDAGSIYHGMGSTTVTINGSNFYGDLANIVLAANPGGVTLTNPTKVSDTELSVDVEIGAAAAITVQDFTVELEGGSSTSSNAASRLEIILPPPTLSTDPAQNHLTLDRPNSGTHVHEFTIDGTNFMNIWDAGNTSDGLRATDGDFVNYYQAGDTMSAALYATGTANAASGLTSFSMRATSATKATGTVTVASNAPLGLVDMEVTTRSGATAVLTGVLDIIPGDPEFTAVAPDAIMEGTGDLVLTLSGANFHPAGDGAIAGSTLLGIKYPYDPNQTNVDFGNREMAMTPAAYRRVHDFVNPVGGELVDVAVDANGAFEIAKFTDTYDANANFAKMQAIDTGGAADSAWAATLADMTADDWVVIRVKLDQTPAAVTDTLTATTAASPSQSISLDANILSEEDYLEWAAGDFLSAINGLLPLAQPPISDPGTIALLQGFAMGPIPALLADLAAYQATNGPDAEMQVLEADLNAALVAIAAL
tara:strand:+ start:2195 stop:4840 length:2646 start_codon:yes stop_codon:yes gene_type:complete